MSAVDGLRPLSVKPTVPGIPKSSGSGIYGGGTVLSRFASTRFGRWMRGSSLTLLSILLTIMVLAIGILAVAVLLLGGWGHTARTGYRPRRVPGMNSEPK